MSVESGPRSKRIAYHDTRNADQSCHDNTEENNSLASIHSGLLVLRLVLHKSKLLGILFGEKSLDKLLDLLFVSEESSWLESDTYLGTLSTNGKEVGVAGVVLLGDYSSISLEDLANGVEVLCALEHDLAGVTLCDLDVSLKHIRVAENKFECRNSHTLRNSNEVENTLVLDASHVEETLFTVLQCVEHHVGNTLKSLGFLLGIE
jgi:hypothetical protein